MSWVMVGMAGVGLLKSEVVDKPKEERQRKVAAETQRWSPWTGMQAGSISEADPLGSMMQGGMAGASMNQNMQDQKSRKELMEAQTGALNRWGTSSSGAPQDLPPPMASPDQSNPAANPMASNQQGPSLYGYRKNPWSFYS